MNFSDPKVIRITKIAGAILAVILAGIAIYFVWDHKKKENEKEKLKEDILDALEDISEIQDEPKPETVQSNLTGGNGVDPPKPKTNSLRDALRDNNHDWSTGDDEFPLVVGSTGPKVLAMKKWLNKTSLANLELTPHFDLKTEKALITASNRANVNKKKWNDWGIDSYQ